MALKKITLADYDAWPASSVCKDHEVQMWVNSFLNFKNKKMKEAVSYFDLARAITEKRVDQMELAKHFWIDGVVWDFPKDITGGPSLFEMFTLVANNPEFSAYVKKRQLP